jgi:hypothetical protein
MNSFKARREQVVLNKKQVLTTIDDAVHFPTLSGPVPVKLVHPIELDYKKATELNDVVIKEELDLDYVPPGWVKYTVDRKTKKIVETYGPEVLTEVAENVKTSEEKQEEIFYEIVDALNANWTRHRNTFIKCHGEDYYNDMFLMKNYIEIDDEEQ